MTDERPKRDDDELLSAGLDGELPESQADGLARRLAREPALASRLEAMRSADEAAAAAFRALDERPMPPRVLELLGEGDAQQRPERGSAKVVPLQKPGFRRFVQAPVAIAASVALLFGIYLGGRLGNGDVSGGGYGSRIGEGSELYAAFDRGLGGEAVSLRGGRTAEPVLTFLSADGAWCRQVRIAGGQAPIDTLACRRGGQWRVELVSFELAASAAPENRYQEASAGGSAAMRAAVDGLMGERPPLDREDEAKVVGGGWPTARLDDGME
ncbi:MAG TPA: hypothetical protein VE175_13990 [Woeseiaceae bacterium]|jgi:hypothetical protein|nr:hypothetical protein [Woeseiaceae bacterium]